MAEWHVTPDYIITNWTEELLAFMVEKLVARKKRETELLNKSGENQVTVSDTQFFNIAGIKRIKQCQ